LIVKLIYTSITSLDGYIADKNGDFDWAEPDEEVHKFINNLQQSIGTYLFGRKMYEVMIAWENVPILPDQPPYILDFATIWQRTEKVVFSTMLGRVFTAKTRIERDFDPEMITRMKEEVEHDILIGGPNLAAQAIKAGLVDEYHLFITPIIVGGGKQFLPDNVWLNLELLDDHRFNNGMIYLCYRSRT
jgi:dihydrofolate reductase